MADEDMAEGVRSLIKEGYSLEKIRANLIKMGYGEQEADDIISRASAPKEEEKNQPAKKPAAEPKPEGAPVAVESPEDKSEEELLLAADDSVPIVPPKPVELPDVEKPPEEEKKHHHHARAVAQPPVQAEVPETMGEETKPKSGTGKAIVILVFAFIIVVIMAYFILLPKLGITLTI